MPETFTTTIKARELRLGDIVVGAYGRSATIAEQPVVGRLYVNTRTSDQAGKVRWELDDDVEVQRVRPTADEQAATRRRQTLEAMDYSEEYDRRQRDNVAAAITASLAKGELPVWSALEELPKYQARIGMWEQVARLHRTRAVESLPAWGGYFDGGVEPQDGDAALSRYDVLRRVAEREMGSVLDAARWGVGRSTSEGSNLLERSGFAGKADWVVAIREALERVDFPF